MSPPLEIPGANLIFDALDQRTARLSPAPDDHVRGDGPVVHRVRRPRVPVLRAGSPDPQAAAGAAGVPALPGGLEAPAGPRARRRGRGGRAAGPLLGDARLAARGPGSPRRPAPLGARPGARARPRPLRGATAARRRWPSASSATSRRDQGGGDDDAHPVRRRPSLPRGARRGLSETAAFRNGLVGAPGRHKAARRGARPSSVADPLLAFGGFATERTISHAANRRRPARS